MARGCCAGPGRTGGVAGRMLRHYDALGLVSPSRQPGGDYRAYGPQDLQRLFEVEGLRPLGLSLAEIGEALAGDGPPPTAVLDSLVAEVEDRIARERDLATRLRRARESTPQDWSEVLSSIALLRSLRSPHASERQSAALSTDATAGPAELVDALLTEDDPHVAGALRWRLRPLGADALEPLTTAFGTEDATVRERALRAAVEALPAQPCPLLRLALADPEPRIRRIAAYCRGRDADITIRPVPPGRTRS